MKASRRSCTSSVGSLVLGRDLIDPLRKRNTRSESGACHARTHRVGLSTEPRNGGRDYDTKPTRTGATAVNFACGEAKLDRVNRAIEDQKRFIRTVPDPDNRERAEANLMSLVLQRDEYVDAQDTFLSGILVK